jgi:fatty acid synthase subunit alpha
MTNVLNFLKDQKIDIAKVKRVVISQQKISSTSYPNAHSRKSQGDAWRDRGYKRAKEQQQNEGYIKLERGFANIPLSGIDVPFQSRYLWAGIMSFRACKITQILYVSHEYAQLIYDQTSSPRTYPVRIDLEFSD